jgi:DNA-binding transcriptional LysR family regulator
MIRQFEYLAALARERHFARAAAACHVTQSTLSTGIKHLEGSLGVLIVARNKRFVGFTNEGERVLFWAHHFLADYSTLRQELGQSDGALIGKLTIGVIPTAEPVVPLLTVAFTARHPHVRIVVRSLSSMEIHRGLCDFSLDVGLTYLDHRPSHSLHVIPIYRESYMLVTSKTGPLSRRKTLLWREAATLPLCLLTPDMENRRIIDKHFRLAQAEVRTSLETNSIDTLWFHLHAGPWSSILPHTFLPLLKDDAKLTGIPLVEPEASSLIGLVAANRDPIAPVVKALLGIAASPEIQKRLEPASKAARAIVANGRAIARD